MAISLLEDFEGMVDASTGVEIERILLSGGTRPLNDIVVVEPAANALRDKWSALNPARGNIIPF